MEITKQSAGQFTELIIKGRLDGYWADHLTSALEEVVRGGADHVRLNLGRSQLHQLDGHPRPPEGLPTAERN